MPLRSVWGLFVLSLFSLIIVGCAVEPTAVPPTATEIAPLDATASASTPTHISTAPSSPTSTATATAEREPTSTAEPAPADTMTPTEPLPTSTDTPMPTDTSTPTEPPPTPTELPPTPTQPPEGAANADVLFVEAVQTAEGSGQSGTWTFHVTVEHPDTGWEDYADGWDVVTPEGIVLKPDPDSQFTRTLLHPHVNEQPFTRSQSGIEIPEGVTKVAVRAHDLADGFGGREVVVDLTVDSGPDFTVERNS